MIQIGIDFGGTKIEAAALDERGEFLARIRKPNPGEYDAAIKAVCDLVSEVESMTGARGSVGMGAPGSIAPSTGLMRNANSLYLNGRPFHQDLQAALGRPLRMANDANCLALSEAVDGSAAGARTVFAIIIGTGCGGGLAIDGRVIDGRNGIAGEWGHTPLPWPTRNEWPGPSCWCGKKGCLETWVSGTGLRRRYRDLTRKSLTGMEIIDAARAGERAARSCLDRYLDRLARAIAMVSNILDPDVFVLGGGMSNLPEIYEEVPRLIKPHLFSETWDTKLVQAAWGDSSGVRGAARLWAPADLSALEAA